MTIKHKTLITLAIRKLSCIFVFVAWTVLPCMAADEGNVRLQLVSFPSTSDSEPVELLLGQGNTTEVEIPAKRLSRSYSVKRLKGWIIGKTVEGSDGKSSFQEYGRTIARASSSQLLILIRKGKTNADGFHIITIDNGGTQFGGGQFLFLNASNTDILGVVGKEKFGIRPGKQKVIQPKPDKGKNLSHVDFAYRRENGKLKHFYSTNWPLKEKMRGLVFFYNDPRTGKVKMHTIYSPVQQKENDNKKQNENTEF